MVEPNLNEFNNDYHFADGNQILTRLYSPLENTENTINFGEPSNVFARNFESFMAERNTQFYDFGSNNNVTQDRPDIYNKIFKLIRDKLFIINEEDDSHNSYTSYTSYTNHTNHTNNLEKENNQDALKEKYSYKESLSVINNLKKVIVELHNRKIEYEILFNSSKEKYSLFSENILKLVEVIKEFKEEGDDKLLELLTNKIEWYYNELKIDSLKSECDSLKKEYLYIKRLLLEFSGFIPATVCQICLDKQINYFISDCGHTLCTDCMEKSKGIRKCHFCRNSIISFKRLYL